MSQATKINETEYVLQDVPRSFLSDECHTRGTLPRVTQPTFGKYLVRVDGRPDYINYKIEIHPSILEKWLYSNRHLWVPKPGHDDDLIHENFQKYSIDRVEYNPKKIFHPLLLPRPYGCELNNIIKGRINAPEAQYFYEEENYCQDKDSVSADKLLPTFSFKPPFWWKEEKVQKDGRKVEKVPEKISGKFLEKRWKPIPNLIKNSKMTCCERKEALQDMGIPFMHEACTFYNTHFPAPKLHPVRKSFSKKN